MRFKLDENLGRGALDSFPQRRPRCLERGAAAPRRRDGSAGARRLRGRGPHLVTLDLDFANPLHHDPRGTPGVAVLRLPANAGPSDVGRAIATLLAAVEHHDIDGSLWIVRPDRVRVWQPTSTEGA